MRFESMINAVDLHCCGEPGRVIVGGVLDVPGNTMFEKMDLQEWFDEADAAPVDEKPDDKPAKPTSEPAVPYGAPQAAANTLQGEVKALKDSVSKAFSLDL